MNFINQAIQSKKIIKCTPFFVAKKTILSFVFVLLLNGLTSMVFAQGHNGLYGNEWIDYSSGKQYYKIKVFQDGMYRVSASVLQSAGANISTINLEGLQVFHEGQEIPIQVESTGGLLDYVQFYGKRNTGAYDINMYNDPTHHFNDKYSLFNDTSAYFLTWGAIPSTKHFTTIGANLSALPAKDQYFMHTNSFVYTNTWNSGLSWAIASEQLTKSTFEYGEGFGSGFSSNRTTIVPSEHPYSAGPSATVDVRVFTTGVYSHVLEIRSGGTTYGSHTFNQYKVGTYSANLPASIIQSSGSPIQVVGTGTTPDNYTLSYVDLTYPRTFDFDGNSIFAFSMQASSSRKYLELNNIDGTNSNLNKFYLYDLTNNVRVQCFYDGSNSRMLTDLAASNSDREMVLINEGNSSSYQDIITVRPITFRDFSSNSYLNKNYIIITHSSLKTNSLGNDPIFDYRLYRQTLEGGNFATIDIDVQELYDQFAYGIANHPLSIRHFSHFAKQNWTNPEYIFLIGKGRTYYSVRGVHSNMLLPTFGYPPSDHLLLASINSDAPTIAVGRLSANTGDQVSLYLQKIIDVEAQRNAAQTLDDLGWTKNILHLGGGKNSNEQNIIRNHLNAMKSTIEAPFYGGNVESFFKTTSSPIQIAQSSYLDNLINSGVSMITFFGHSSANSFDFNLDHPEQYTNYQKYPLIMALGCYGGTMFEFFPFISEDFIFEPQAGAGVFLASVGATALSALNAFAQEFYLGISNSTYNEGAAKAAKNAITRLETSNTGYPTTIQMACHYMSYHGDPAYKVSNAAYPDYYIDDSLVSHSPSIVTVQAPTFDLEIDIYNLGKAINDSFKINIERIHPDGTSGFAASIDIKAPFFTSNITIPIEVGNATALGINKFNIEIDSDYEIDERPTPSAENNNTVLQYEVLISSDNILPVYPYEFSIVPETPITLKASTGNVFATTQTYLLQIDTTAYFNSPILQSTSITQTGGLVEWTPALTTGFYMDSTVYYWRIAIDTTSSSINAQWASSSFIYLDASYPGWNQSHFFQFLKDTRTNLVLEEPNRRFDYITSIQTVTAATGETYTPYHPENIAIYFNGSKLDKCRCPGRHGVYVSVIEPETLKFWELDGPNGNSNWGGYNCDGAGRTTPTFLFYTTTLAGQDSLQEFINNVIPNGHYVLAYTLNNSRPDSWSPALKNAFKSQGALFVDSLASISSAQDVYPWATFFKKGDLSYIHNTSELVGVDSFLTIDGLLQEDWYQGSQTSTIVGPANYWGSMHWRHDTLANDNVSVEIYGLDINKNTRTLLIGPTTVLDTSLTNIDPALYPYLELVWNSVDPVDKTSPQLTYWRILGEMAPEAALNPSMFLVLDSACVQQGQEIRFEVAMENISLFDMDSMLVRFEIVGSPLQKVQRLDSLLKDGANGDTLHAYVTFPTVDLSGNQQLLIEINPYNDQPEKYHFNNIGLIPFKVQTDILNPILDVTFDGIHIMNKDIVSGQPEILIQLSDENQYLSLDALDDFGIILRHSSFPDGEMLLSPETTDMQFYPADPTKLSTENKAKIIIHPDLISDGMYTLFVSASDKTGNNSGQLSYSIDFEVINKPSISNMLNYPNPFSTSTQFVFTLTGRELPNYMKIQILTVTGKVVREITQQELGPLRIGINRTEYAWNGKDEYGDQLANGVYLYRVITKRDGADYDIYSTRTDYMFRQGFGKMYLMR